MKKTMFLYLGFVYIICLIICFISIIEKYFQLDFIFLFVYSCIGLLSLYNIYKKKSVLISLKFIYITNLIQSVTIFYSGFRYFFLVGPSLTFYIYKEIDLFTKLKFSIFNLRLDFNSIDTNINILGINFFQLFIGIYVYILSKKIKIDKES